MATTTSRTATSAAAVEGVQIVGGELVEGYGAEGGRNPAVDLLAVFVKRLGGAAIVLDLGQPVGEERAESA